jgi:metallo-beta-lactamase class B
MDHILINSMRIFTFLAAAFLAFPAFAAPCEICFTWNKPHPPFQIYADTYYVGVDGLSAILITSPQGHVLIDGALEQSSPLIAANIKALGFRIEDVKVILNSHDHYDHAGGIAELQRLSGAMVKASASSAAVLKAGKAGRDDPQFSIADPYPPVAKVETLRDGETVKVGPLALTAHFTPGHTPGGTTWTWDSCEAARCLHMVYADSLTPLSSPEFRFSKSAAYPNVLKDFQTSIATVGALRCDILITPHPGASDLFGRLERRSAGNKDGFLDAEGCRTYADRAQVGLDKRLADEKAGK